MAPVENVALDQEVVERPRVGRRQSLAASPTGLETGPRRVAGVRSLRKETVPSSRATRMRA
jgi:hypothetical protein